VRERAVDKCPHCDKPLKVSLFATAEKESSLTFAITPKKGSFIGVATLGKSLANMEDLIRASGKALKVKSTAFVKKASTDDDGKISVEMLIVNAEPPKKR
jgi:hypothetical protein